MAKVEPSTLPENHTGCSANIAKLGTRLATPPKSSLGPGAVLAQVLFWPKCCFGCDRFFEPVILESEDVDMQPGQDVSCGGWGASSAAPAPMCPLLPFFSFVPIPVDVVFYENVELV